MRRARGVVQGSTRAGRVFVAAVYVLGSVRLERGLWVRTTCTAAAQGDAGRARSWKHTWCPMGAGTWRVDYSMAVPRTTDGSTTHAVSAHVSMLCSLPCSCRSGARSGPRR